MTEVSKKFPGDCFCRQSAKGPVGSMRLCEGYGAFFFTRQLKKRENCGILSREMPWAGLCLDRRSRDFK